jgi:uncharacterized protein (TIGR00730 family)
MERVLVFCGSHPGRDPAYVAAAQAFGREAAARGLGVVYGGASVGLMGALADSALAAGGEVIGIIPRMLVNSEIAHVGVTDLKIVETMHERKALMASLADTVVALPGGTGTLDELFEIITWAQIGLHAKPIGLLDVVGYWAPLLAFLDHAVAERFVRAENRDALVVHDSASALLDGLAARGRGAGAAAPDGARLDRT